MPLNEESFKLLQLKVEQLEKISAEQAKVTFLLLGLVRVLSSQLNKDEIQARVQKAIQDLPFDPRVSKGDQERMRAKAIELIPVYFP